MALYYYIWTLSFLVQAIAGTVAIPAESNASFCIPHKLDVCEQQRLFFNFVREFYIEKNIAEAFHQHVREDYIQHNPFVLSGAQPSIDYLAPLLPQLNVTIYHHALDQNIGWVHYRIQGDAAPVETAIVDVYRFDGSCVVEHWDVIESLPANATNPLALF